MRMYDWRLEAVGFGWAKFGLKKKTDNIISVFKLLDLVGGIMCLYSFVFSMYIF